VHPPRLLCPPPGELLGHLLDVDRCAPLAVLDPTWPAPLRRQAEADLAAAAQADRLGDGDLVVFTSGSGGRPRGVVRTAASWRASLPALTEITGISPADVVWLPGPLTSSLSLYGAYHAAWLGARVVTGPLARLDPADARAVTAAHVVPTLLAQLLAAPGRADRLPGLRTVVAAGEPLLEPLWHSAREVRWRLVEYYGAAELSFVGTRSQPGPLRAFPGADVRVRDGVVQVRSPFVARGYLAPDDDGPLVREGGWASVGDRGSPVDGGFVVHGRGTGAVTTGGHTVLAEEVEAVLAGVRGVQHVVVVGLPDARLGQLLAAVVVPGAPGLLERLRAAARALPTPARPTRWLAAERLPLTPSGKVSRAQVADEAAGLPPLR
jgi:acyl-coenzyme A synthetase/AMP-(fatty) acid ligase